MLNKHEKNNSYNNTMFNVFTGIYSIEYPIE